MSIATRFATRFGKISACFFLHYQFGFINLGFIIKDIEDKYFVKIIYLAIMVIGLARGPGRLEGEGEGGCMQLFIGGPLSCQRPSQIP